MLRYLLILALIVCAREATAVNVVIDYSLDTSDFFDASTANGQKARGTVEFAAAYLSELLVDNLSSIENPPDFAVTFPPQFGGQTATIEWGWTATFFNPATGIESRLDDLVIAEDEYRLFVGARQLGPTTVGLGGPGGGGRTNGTQFIDGNGQVIVVNEQAELDAIQSDFDGSIGNRLQAGRDFASWGGTTAFDIDANWNFDYRVEPAFGQADLLSVALHEFVHVLGFGLSDEFEENRTGTSFTGANAREANGGVDPQVVIGEESGTAEHWAQGSTSSTIFGTDIQQTALLEPVLQGGRQLLTNLDIAALADIGWEIALPGDYNGDGLVNTSDYAVWRNSLSTPNVIGDYDVWSESVGSLRSNTFLAPSGVAAPVPEPASATALLALAALVVGARRRR